MHSDTCMLHSDTCTGIQSIHCLSVFSFFRLYNQLEEVKQQQVLNDRKKKYAENREKQKEYQKVRKRMYYILFNQKKSIFESRKNIYLWKLICGSLFDDDIYDRICFMQNYL